MKTVYETSSMSGNAHVSCIKYRNLNNISHYHSDHELVYVSEGRAVVIINENIFNLTSGESVFIHSNDIHCIQSDETTIVTVLKAKRKYFENIFASRRLLSPIIGGDPELGNKLHRIGLELELGHENSDIMADSMVTQIFITLLRSAEVGCIEAEKLSRPSTAEIYTEICRKISEEYSTVTFEKIAEHMHFSGPYFSKLFHSIFGMTFTRYLNTVKVAAAIEKLREGNLSITEISSMCGFNTIRTFNRVFRSFTGYAPKDLPSNYVFLYSLKDGCGLNPTLNCTKILAFAER